MAQKPLRIPKNVASGKARVGQDMVSINKQREQFAGLGKTLPNYQYDPRDKHRLPGPTVVKKRKITFKKVAITFFICLMVVGGFITGKLIWNSFKLFGSGVFNVLDNTKLKGEDVGRVNVLLAGNSADDVGHEGGELTDSIMLMSIDTRNNKAFLMSIPRDLYVDIDGEGHAKINTAYVQGKNSKFNEKGFPKGGMGLLQKTVEESLGVDINYYALVNYQALKQAVDAVSGVDVVIKSDDPRGLFDPNIDWKTKKPLVDLSNGKHHLNGQQALNLARARGDSYRSYGFAGSDFDRTDNQRKLMVGLKDKASSPSVIANPSKVAKLVDAVGNNVSTDFKPNELRRLYSITKKIPSNKITSVGLNDADGKNLLTGYTTRDGQSALIPAAGLDDFGDIQYFLGRLMSSNPLVQEGAKLVVLNGTTYNGLATAKKKQLSSKKLNIVGTGDANTTKARTLVIDASKNSKPETRNFLKKLYGDNFTTTNPYVYVYDADFIIELGDDQIPKPKNDSPN